MASMPIYWTIGVGEGVVGIQVRPRRILCAGETFWRVDDGSRAIPERAGKIRAERKSEKGWHD
eukprot:3863554-Pyramimonas_sp.AAC.1